MKKFNFIPLFYCLLFTSNVYSQKGKSNHCQQQPLTIVFEVGEKFKNRKKLTSIKNGEVLISFKENFNDSIQTYIDGDLIREDFVVTSAVELVSCHTCYDV